jgi:hypothetical protein
MADLRERQERVRLYLKKLGLDKKTDLKVLLVGQTFHFKPVKVGFSLTIIRINPNLSDDEFDRTFTISASLTMRPLVPSISIQRH